MSKKTEDFIVLENNRLNDEFYTLKLKAKDKLEKMLPGQFVQVLIEDSPKTFLRRPISIYDVDYTENCILLLIKIAGIGTSKLSEIKAKQKVNLVYPLGNSFTPVKDSNVILIGGGTGVAPMLFLGKYLKEKMGVLPSFLLGYRNSKLIIEQDKFEQIGKVYITTEDGSTGHRGFVIDHPVLSGKNQFDMIYTCGPEVMMKAVSRLAKEKSIACEVSLENLMGCGFGACLCCVVDTFEKGNVNTCTEGPIFNSEKLKWLI